MITIEFRVWHKELEEYVLVHKYCTLAKDGIHSSDCIIEQYTGVKDRHGNKIYVGDVVTLRGGKKPRGEDRPLYTTDVVFKSGLFTVRVNKSILNDHAALGLCTVVGNIHQNPELLEK